MMQLLGIEGPVVESTQLPANDTLELQLGSIRGARVLLVEDNEINQLVACEMLRSVGFVVDVAHDGRLAVELVHAACAHQRPYDLVLMDMQMPVMDGVTAARLIRQRVSAQELPIIAMTANAMESDRERCLQAGMNGYVTKPISPDELWQAILQWVQPRDGLGSSVRPPMASEATSAPLVQEMADALMDALRAIPGLNVGVGLLRTANKPDFYASMLRKFVISQEEAVRHMRQSLAVANTPMAALLAHTLKGLAGSLGAMRLFESADALEQLLGTDCDLQQLEHALAATDSLLQELVQALRQTPGFAQDRQVLAYGTLSEPEIRTARQVLREIKTCLQDNNANALEIWEAHVGILRPLLRQWAQVEVAIGAFEFERAMELLSQDVA
jgi:CheY-like chemotaxis protein/HPt (histidine-containing phosphotransfer) domain-containing protein